MGVSLAAFGFITYISNFYLLIVTWFSIRVLEGMSSSTILTACYSIVATTYKDNQSKYLGYLEAASGLSMLISQIESNLCLNVLNKINRKINRVVFII